MWTVSLLRVMPFGTVGTYKHFDQTYRLHLQAIHTLNMKAVSSSER
jgi:hypothetical protein